MLKTSLFDYDLPEELIARYPAEKRDGSKMMILDRQSGEAVPSLFPEIINFLEPGDALIYNDTKVLKGRMYGVKKNENGEPGAKFELLLVSPSGNDPAEWHVLLKPGKRAKPGTVVMLTDSEGRVSDDYFEVAGRFEEENYTIRFSTPDVASLQEKYGHIPLPPYINRPDENADADRYQTVYAQHSGAVAAPTAGLHFTPELLEAIRQKGVRTSAVTLHVGPGTFKPVSVEDATQHKMHFEDYILTPETAELVNTTHSSGHRVLAVGTTTVRVLESCVDDSGTVHPQSGRTDIFLYPPAKPKAVDMLLTNFHLPKSTLLMLVSCFVPREKVLEAYRLAIAEKFRFYSYGDCMLIK
ncbi:MAG: tRNA preQ1(34) S-adenosylmethionine ribosyltransferase-isomerase QueA [Lentisphaeria bacterium]|nr:tRNA preQ1(34) S-adenosylmethionine ribosyltransferase-isomerase QueA [Lentisphaeria bacterium]